MERIPPGHLISSDHSDTGRHLSSSADTALIYLDIILATNPRMDSTVSFPGSGIRSS